VKLSSSKFQLTGYGGNSLKILHRYLLQQVLVTALAAIVTLTLIVLMFDAFKRLTILLIDNDVSMFTILHMMLLLVPQALTLTIPCGLLTGIVIVFGRMSHSLEITAIRAAGLGLIPFIAPVILLSMVMSLFCLYNNAVLAPQAMTRFKLMFIDMARDNPTAFLRAQEPITRFSGMSVYVEKKYGNTLEGIHIWKLGENNIPETSTRADRGIISADLQDMSLTITLINARQEDRNKKDPSRLDQIETGMKAAQLPIKVSIRDMLDTTRISNNISILPIEEIRGRIFGNKGKEINMIPLLTELQRRMVFSLSCFTFALVGVPLAISTGRKETSVGCILSLGVAVSYFLLVLIAMAFKENASAYPELIVWLPTILFQGLGFWLLAKVNSHPV
jgi:lipopolysaccharide export system permease protein